MNAFPSFTPDCHWAILQHVPWEGPGLIQSIARARGISVKTYRLDLTPAFPNLEDIGGLIVMGGPMGAYETEKYPFLVHECALISEMVRRDRPVLGVCLGAQLLAKSLGARVFSGPASEIGFGSAVWPRWVNRKCRHASGTLGRRYLKLRTPGLRSQQVATVATGDELIALGETPSIGQIVNSNSYSLAPRGSPKSGHRGSPQNRP